MGCLCNCFRRAKLHGYKYTSRLSNSTIVPGIPLTFSWLLIDTLLLLASGVEPNPCPSRRSVSSTDTDDASLCTTNCHVCKLGTSDLKFLVCFRCLKLTHVSCLVFLFKLQSEVPLRNSHKWLCDFLSFHHFNMFARTAQVFFHFTMMWHALRFVTSDQTDISSKDMLTSNNAVNVSDILETDIKPQSSNYVQLVK